MRKQFEELHPLFDLEKDEQGEYMCVLTRVTWLGFELGKKTLQAEIDQLKAQLNNMEACYIEKKKQVDVCAALAAGWSAITWDKTTHWTEGYEEGCYHCSRQIEEALRGAND